MHEAIKIVAQYFLVIPVAVALYYLVRFKGQQRLELLATFVAGGVISLLLAKLGSHFYYNARPFVQGHFTPLIAHPNDNGFPSSHMLLASFLALNLWRYSRKTGTVLLVVAALIGLSRMAAGVHHLSDILGSLVFAAVGCWLGVWLTHRVLSKKTKDAEPA